MTSIAKRLFPISSMIAVLAVLIALVSINWTPSQSAEALPGEVLILGPTVTGGLASVEAVKVTALGRTPVVVDAATWGAMTTADFADYDAIVLGDPTCGFPDTPMAAAIANAATWGPAITGNVVVIGTDPVFHDSQGGNQVTESGITFAVDEAGETGAYITTSCYYFTAGPGTPLPWMDTAFGGSFTIRGQDAGCPADSHIVAVHPALAGLTDADLSNWGCSTHMGFDTWAADWLVLAISEDIPSTYVAGDGTTGAPYIIARGEDLEPVGEICGDGIDNDGDGEIDEDCEPENSAPDCDAASPSPALLWPPNHKMVPVEVVVPDADGDPVTVVITSIYQDEEVDAKASGPVTVPDGSGVGTDTANVRAERVGNPKTPGNGRVYHIGFTADDGNGGVCSGHVLVGVPHDMGGNSSPVDDGALYDSTVTP